MGAREGQGLRQGAPRRPHLRGRARRMGGIDQGVSLVEQHPFES
ncbi:hypothetical protein MA5S0421_0566 [Mycobacteroides abscessus 5S-0421]|nr:hypothetical protein MA5S0421_0566 [Mycobacteroides abscessus 5S-0421]EIU33362.1 hypothetical protein MA5S0817_0342 [Mycobacteroides abscessus 5S-0817]EIU42201.1 hypothetical protein MA5S1215_1761 [Mycobacteroides abscessus 5S-1215]